MKTIFYFILFSFYGFQILAQQQIPEGNFENWSNNEIPPWHTSLNIAGYDIYTATQTTDSYQGNYAVKLTSQTLFSQFIPGLLTLGDIDILNQTLRGGIPYNDKPDGISFFFKYIPSGVDTMAFGVFLTKWDTVSLTTDTIGITGYINSNTYNTYTQVNLPFVYSSSETPDTLNIIFTSSGFNGNDGSILFIDSLSTVNGTIVSPTFCLPADEITSSGFKTHWMSIPDAKSYSIDISDNSDFTSYIEGYENLNTGIDTFYTVNVSPGTYYYRVRVNYDSETSINSNTIEVVVEDTSDIKHFKTNNIKVFSGRGTISSSSDKIIKKVNIYSVDGKLISSKNSSSKKIDIDINSYGIFIVEIVSKDTIFRKKVSLFY